VPQSPSLFRLLTLGNPMLESTYDFDFTSIPTNPESTHNISESETPESRCGSYYIDPWPKGKPVWLEYDSPSSPTKIRRGVTSRLEERMKGVLVFTGYEEGRGGWRRTLWPRWNELGNGEDFWRNE
jgi:hypothetical protein